MADKSSFSCGEHVDISQAIQLHQRLKRCVAKDVTVELKADKIQKADTAGLQLLLAAVKDLHEAGNEVCWRKPSEAFISAAETLGMSQALKLN